MKILKNSYENFIIMGKKNYRKQSSWRILETLTCIIILQRKVCGYVCTVFFSKVNKYGVMVKVRYG